MFKRSIRFRLIAIFFGLTAGPLLVVGAWAGWQNFLALQGAIENTQQLEAKRVGIETEEYLKGLTERFLLVCNTQSLLEIGDRQRFAILNDLVAYEKAIQEFVLLSSDGHRLAHLTRGQARNLIDLENDWLRPDFLKDLMEKGIIYSPIYYDEPQSPPYMVVATPVMNPRLQTLTGVGLARVSLGRLNDFLAGLDLQPQEEVMILGPDNRVVGRSHPGQAWDEFRHVPYEPLIVNGVNTDPDGRRTLVGLSGFNLGTRRFTVLAKVDYWRTMSHNLKLALTLGLGLALCLFMALMVGISTVKKIIRPIEELAEAALAIKSGDYSRRVKPAARNELGQLAEAFNTMAADLENTIKRLKGEIISKTKAEEALRQSELHFRQLVEHSPLGILVLNRRGKIVGVNPKGLEILGFESLQQAGSLFFNDSAGFFQPESAGPPFSFGPDYALQAATRVMEVVYTPPSGPPKDLRCHLSLEPSRPASADDDLPGAVFQLIIEDISEAKRLESHFRQSQKLEALGTLTGGIVHDFNNILSAVIGYTELALTELDKPDILTHHLQQIMGASQRARELIQQILSFSRRTVQEKKPVQLAALVKEILKMIRATMPSTIWIVSNVDDNLPPVLADVTQIHQVLMNLCTNAAHAMKEKGGVLTVNLAAVTVDGPLAARSPDLRLGRIYQLLEVIDTGHGIPSKNLSRIFEPFFTTKEAGEGTGMGLSVVHGVVQGHGGVIIVDSQEGQGAAFRVYLPQTELEAIQDKTKPEQASQLRGHEIILFVDDEPALVDIGCRSLERLGYQVVGKTSSGEALEEFSRNPDKFQIVITDQTMPNLTGMELAEKMIRLKAGLPVILCTGFTQKITLERARAIGIRQVMLKPVLIKDLALVIRRIFDQNSQLAGNLPAPE